MPDLRIVTWNSTGENPVKAVEIGAIPGILAPMYPANPNVDVYLIQEAQNGPGGAISLHLGGLAGHTMHHLAEQPGGGGAGYICATRNAAAAVVVPLTLYNYAVDPNFGAHIAPLPGIVNVMNRPPAYTVLTVAGSTVLLITWHAPLGVSLLPIIVGAMPGGALIDAFIALDNSQLIQAPAAVAGGPVHIVIIAGDLNVTAAGLAGVYGGYNPLNNFNGLSHHLDHILAWRPVGGAWNVVEGHNTASTSVHDIMSARVNW